MESVVALLVGWTVSEIKVQGCKDLYICSLYRPPGNTDPQYLETLQNYMTRVPVHREAHMWIGGDFNLPNIQWESNTVNQHAVHGVQSQQLITLMNDFFLDQVVKEPTRITETQLKHLGFILHQQ